MKKILLVDSPGATIVNEQSFLHRANVTLFTARSGKEAIRIYREQLPDIVIVDFNLSDMSGPELCEEIFAIKRCPVLMMIEKGDNDAVRRCQKAWVDDFIFKPVNQKEIIRKVGTLLSIPQREDFRILMKVRVEGRREGNFFMGNTIDISTSGTLLETHHKEIDVGDRLECSFFLPWKLKAVTIRGQAARKVKGKESFQYGIRFLELDPTLKEEIRDYIKKKEKIEDL